MTPSPALDDREAPPEPTVAAHWERLVAVAILGTDRRNPPDAPAPIADVVDDRVDAAPARRMLTHVAATVAVRRGGVVPAPAVAPLLGPPPDERPPIGVAAARRWHEIVGRWPILEDEWLLTVVERGRRVAPDLVPDLLTRHRTDPVRRARAFVACGPLAIWLTGQLPSLGPGPASGVDADAVTSLPDLPIPAELRALVDEPGATTGATLATAIRAGELAHAHRGVLVNLVARVRPDTLAAIHQALAAIDPAAPGGALAGALADLADLRRSMLTELATAAP